MYKSFTPFKPFVMEMLITIFVIASIIAGLLCGQLVEIYFHANLLTITALILLILILLYILNRVISVGVKGLLDYLLNNIVLDEYVFIAEEPYRASVFSETLKKDDGRSLEIYYLVHVKKHEHDYTFLSSKYLELEIDKKYFLSTGKSSGIIVDFHPITQTN